MTSVAFPAPQPLRRPDCHFGRRKNLKSRPSLGRYQMRAAETCRRWQDPDRGDGYGEPFRVGAAGGISSRVLETGLGSAMASLRQGRQLTQPILRLAANSVTGPRNPAPPLLAALCGWRLAEEKAMSSLSLQKEKDRLLESLESLVDRNSLQGVLLALAEVCAEKCEHCQTNWQDQPLAREWSRAGKRLDTLASQAGV